MPSVARVALLAGLCLFASTSCKKKELPPDPTGMQRAMGGKLSIPLPEGWEVITTGAPSIEKNARGGGITIVNKRKGAKHGGTIVADVGTSPALSWTAAQCKKVSEEANPNYGPAVEKPQVLDLPTGQTCHFVLRDTEGVQRDFYLVAGRPLVVVLCRTTGPSPDVADKCKHIASWVRRFKKP